MHKENRIEFDVDSYVKKVQTGPCFVCGIAAGDGRFPAQHVVFRDNHHVAFLPGFHVLRGYVLVAPIEHREAVADDFSLDEYLALQTLVIAFARLESDTATERVFLPSQNDRARAFVTPGSAQAVLCARLCGSPFIADRAPDRPWSQVVIASLRRVLRMVTSIRGSVEDGR